jgi:hypothetical protein
MTAMQQQNMAQQQQQVAAQPLASQCLKSSKHSCHQAGNQTAADRQTGAAAAAATVDKAGDLASGDPQL